jgi:hypothetical protein
LEKSSKLPKWTSCERHAASAADDDATIVCTVGQPRNKMEAEI